jgi:predicted ester cyclase
MNQWHKKARIERIFDHVNSRDLNGLDDVLHPDYLDHTPWGELQGVHAFKEFMQVCWLNPFPDAWFEVSNILIDGDLAAWQTRFTGINSGGFAPACLAALPSTQAALMQWSLMGMPPTGSSVDVVGLHIARLGDRDRPIERWTGNDQLAMIQQLGLIPNISTALAG